MISNLCNCDEMIAKTEFEDPTFDSHREMALSWDCPKHGKVSVDFRSVSHTHPPAHASSFEVTGERKKPWHTTRFSAGGGD